MKNYIDNTTKEIYAYEADGSQDSYIKDGLVPINNDDLLVLRASQLKAEQDLLTYSDKRKAKYDLLNQDEMRYDDLINNTTTWRDGIAAIKVAHPKP